jgi:hypothetical protein
MKKLIMAAAVLVCASACAYGSDPAAPAKGVSEAPSALDEPVAENTGSLSFDLQAQGGVKIDAFSYTITGPNFARSSSIDVSNSTTVSTLIDGIPVGSGYSLSLSGESIAPAKASCSGSASFSIAAGVVTNVPVQIDCHLADAAPPDPGTPMPAPLPPFAPALLGFVLLGLGARRAREATVSRPR